MNTISLNENLLKAVSFVICIFIILIDPNDIIINGGIESYFELRKAIPVKRYTLEDYPPIAAKNSIIFGNHSKPCRQFLNSNAKRETELLYFPSSLVREYKRLYHFKNIYASTRYSLAIENGIVDLWPNLTYLPYLDKPTVGPYDHVVYLATLWPNVFGHLIHDVLSSLITFPTELLEKSYLLVPFNLNITKQYLQILGFPLNNVIQHNGSWVFAQNLYLQVPLEPVNALSVIGLPLVTKKLHERLMLDRTKPTRYVFSNREKNQQRYVHNFHAFFDATKNAFPEYPWEIANVNNSNVARNAQQMNLVKVWVVPSGSNVFNIIFMNKEAGICLIMSEYADYPNFGAAYALDLLMIGFTNDFKHWHTNGGSCDVQLGVQTVGKLIDMMESNNYSLERGWKLAFNIPQLWKLVEDKPEECFSVAKIPNFKSNVLF